MKKEGFVYILLYVVGHFYNGINHEAPAIHSGQRGFVYFGELIR